MPRGRAAPGLGVSPAVCLAAAAHGERCRLPRENCGHMDLLSRPDRHHERVAGRQRPGAHRARVPRRVRFKSRRCCVPKGRSPSVRACHGGMPLRGRTCPGLPWGPTVPVPSLVLHGGLSETPPQPRAVFLMVCIASGGILEITSSCGTFVILVTSASSSLRNRHDAPLMPASEATGWAKPLPSSIRPR